MPQMRFGARAVAASSSSWEQFRGYLDGLDVAEVMVSAWLVQDCPR